VAWCQRGRVECRLACRGALPDKHSWMERQRACLLIPTHNLAACIALTVVLMSACSSPTSPGACVNGRDGLGRSPISQLRATCVPRNLELQCQSTRVEEGYCANGLVDVTATAQWISTNSSVAVSTGFGHFQLQSPGVTVIYSESGGLFSLEAFGYRLAATGELQQVGVVDVYASQPVGGFIPLASVNFTSATSTQDCQQGSGAPYTPCRFWTDFNLAVVRASAPGYIAGQI